MLLGLDYSSIKREIDNTYHSIKSDAVWDDFCTDTIATAIDELDAGAAPNTFYKMLEDFTLTKEEIDDIYNKEDALDGFVISERGPLAAVLLVQSFDPEPYNFATYKDLAYNVAVIRVHKLIDKGILKHD